jgi:hypothetical protein
VVAAGSRFQELGKMSMPQLGSRQSKLPPNYH